MAKRESDQSYLEVSDELAAEVISAAKPRVLHGCYAEHELATTKVLGWILTMLRRRLAGTDTPTNACREENQPTFEQVKQLHDAHDEFLSQLEKLQPLADPPPLPAISESGMTVWDSWMAGHHIGFAAEDGISRKAQFEHKSIRYLISFYDEVMNEKASHSYGNKPGPFARFVEKAFEVSAASLSQEIAGTLRVPQPRTYQYLIKKHRGDEKTTDEIHRLFSDMKDQIARV